MADRRQAILAEAHAWLGTPYHHAASVRGVGCDCFGLLAGIWRAVCGALPEPVPAYTRDWGEADAAEPLLAAAHRHFRPVSEAEMAPADLLVFRWRPRLAAKHVAILSAAGRMIHAYDGVGVVEVALVPAWRRRLTGVFAFPETD